MLKLDKDANNHDFWQMICNYDKSYSFYYYFVTVFGHGLISFVYS